MLLEEKNRRRLDLFTYSKSFIEVHALFEIAPPKAHNCILRHRHRYALAPVANFNEALSGGLFTILGSRSYISYISSLDH